jgi:hypothetical protein
MLRTFIAAAPKPIGKRLGAHLPASAIEKQERRLRSAFLPGEPVKKCRFGLEGFGRASRNSNTTLEIVTDLCLVRVARS